MTAAELAWTAGVLAAAAFSAARLLRAPARGQQGTRDGYRWLAAAAACAGSGAAVQRWFAGVVGGAEPLRVADLIALAALPALVIGVATLAAGQGRGGATAAHQSRGLPARLRAGWPAGAAAADSCLFTVSLFVICLVSVLGPGEAAAAASPAALAVTLIRPAADLIASGLLLRFVARAPAVTVAPALALAAFTLSDCLAARDRIDGSLPGAPAQALLIAGLGLLAAAPAGTRPWFRPGWAAREGPPARMGRAGRPGQARAWSDPAALAALIAAASAAVTVTGAAVAGGLAASPALAVAGAGMVILLVIRLALAARQASVVAAGAMESDRAFRLLADSAIDAVLVCDLGGVVGYASPAVADFGYSPGALAGARLADLVHPEDLPAGIRAVARVLRERRAAGPRPERHGPGGAGDPGGAARHGTAVPFAGRVRGADGSWHHIEASLSLCAGPGEPARMLVTARDVSDRVELRRQVTRLTFQDGLTGLPNRAYLEERVRELCREPRPVALTLVDLDGYAAVNDLVGRPGGDLILAQVGRLVRAAAPPDATAGRWGGDEFAIVTADAAPDAELAGLAERLAGRIAAEPFAAAGHRVPLTASVGTARSAPGGDPSERARHLLAAAHAAMIRARQAGGGRAEIFAEGMPSVPARPSG